MTRRSRQLPDGIKCDALMSTSRAYRYWLTREWNAERPRVGFVMLNPSTADAWRDDPTIRRCIGFARQWGFGSLVVVNLFAFRATDPTRLLRADDPVGPMNAETILRETSACDLVVCAWGNHGHDVALVSKAVIRSKGGVWCLGITKLGEPRHPLYVRRDAELVAFDPVARTARSAHDPRASTGTHEPVIAARVQALPARSSESDPSAAFSSDALPKT